MGMTQNITKAPRSIQSLIYWAVNNAIKTTAERDAWGSDFYPINAKPGKVIASGILTLANGQKREAERVFAHRGATLLRYVTPAGRWKTSVSPADVFTVTG